MKGINYIVNANDKKLALMIDLKLLEKKPAKVTQFLKELKAKGKKKS